ncbi:MAG TPA: 2OG-Fe(II) oxygenase [Kofleriaceae bacterium]|nr:2OG-Fe(II) oxygenase [Kofleriaceae bacterium]
MSRSLIVVDRFAPEATELRATFDARFAEPRRARDDRFVWDWWHVPGQYTHLRTPAWTYFPRALYERFHRRLVAWGREVLGCHDVSPPWLSCYVDGCRQELHGDLPHGPWAFVFSLTRWRGRAFSGGETLLVRDEVLDYWHEFPRLGIRPSRGGLALRTRGVEQDELVRAVEPKFARLVAFDPRIPHGVREVRGTQDPRAGRLVIHGWFVQPRPFVRGPLAPRPLLARAHELGALVGQVPMAGMLALAFGVDRRGGVRDLRLLSDTTRVPRGDERARLAVVRAMRRAVAGWRFGPQRGPSRVTLPLVFELT